MTEQEINKIAAMMELHSYNSEYVTIKFKKDVPQIDRVAYGFDTYGTYRLDKGLREEKTFVSISDGGTIWTERYSKKRPLQAAEQLMLSIVVKVTCILLPACSEHLFEPIPNPTNFN